MVCADCWRRADDYAAEWREVFTKLVYSSRIHTYKWTLYTAYTGFPLCAKERERHTTILYEMQLTYLLGFSFSAASKLLALDLILKFFQQLLLHWISLVPSSSRPDRERVEAVVEVSIRNLQDSERIRH